MVEPGRDDWPTDLAPLILLPGMGADARMFSAIRDHLPQVVTPPWIAPRRNESVVEYARRYAQVIDPGRPFFIGGTSFGGVVAQEIAAILPNVFACFVIGSIRSERNRPWSLQLFQPVTPFVGVLPRVSPLLVRCLGPLLRAPTREIMTELGDADPAFLRWGTSAVLKWSPSPEVAAVRIHQIHGDSDRVFPASKSVADQTIPGAGHLVAITHPKVVAEFLREQMAAAESPAV